MTDSNVATIEQGKKRSLVRDFAKKYGVEDDKMLDTLKKTAFKQSGNTTIGNEQMMALLVVANQYDLNPFTKEIYAFPSNGGIQPIVSIDGWMKIINSHDQFDGMKFIDHKDDRGGLSAVTCQIFRKDRNHPTEVTEYLSECKRNTDPWKQWPARMLRHKAAIQCARYAFSFSGIVDPDEAERIIDVTPKDAGQSRELPPMKDETFNNSLTGWRNSIEAGNKTAADIIAFLQSKYTLSAAQIETINSLEETVIDGELVDEEENNENS